MQKTLSIIIKAKQDFIRHTAADLEANAPVLNSFYESISYIYIPLLRMVEKLAADNVKFRFGLVLPPVLCNMLSDESLQNDYIRWLEERNDFGKAELRRNKGDEKVCAIIKASIEENNSLKADFTEKYGK